MQPLPEKQCRICKEFKTRDNFYKSKKLPGGLVHECKTCIAILSKAYVEANAEAVKERKKKYRQENKQKIQESQKRSVAKKPEHYKSKQKEYSSKNRDSLIAKSREYYQTNKDTILAQEKLKRKTDPSKNLLSAAKKRSQCKNLEFSLTKEDIVIPNRCPILGIDLGVGNGKKEKGSPSIDRLDNTKGYTKENSWVISSLANTMKQDASCEELIHFALWCIGDNCFLSQDLPLTDSRKKRRLSSIKNLCKHTGLPFDLTLDCIHLPSVCPILGIPLVEGKNFVSYKNLMTVDRIILEAGYVKSNVRIISRMASLMKANASFQELDLFSAWVLEVYAPDYISANQERVKCLRSKL